MGVRRTIRDVASKYPIVSARVLVRHTGIACRNKFYWRYDMKARTKEKFFYTLFEDDIFGLTNRITPRAEIQ